VGSDEHRQINSLSVHFAVSEASKHSNAEKRKKRKEKKKEKKKRKKFQKFSFSPWDLATGHVLKSW
jgi:hypothetical protein